MFSQLSLDLETGQVQDSKDEQEESVEQTFVQISIYDLIDKVPST